MSEENTKITPEQEALSGKYLTFILEEESYGVEIIKVREIIGVPEMTEVPCSSEYIRGVINLRGRIIPVLDLRKKFGMSPAELADKSCIIIIDAQDNAHKQMGILVDLVSEVVNVQPEQIECSPDVGGQSSSVISALAKFENGIKILLNIEQILDIEGEIILSENNVAIEA